MNLINREEFSECLTESQKGMAARKINKILKSAHMNFIGSCTWLIIVCGFFVLMIIHMFPHIAEIIESNFDPRMMHSHSRDLDGPAGVVQDILIFVLGIPIVLWQTAMSIGRLCKDYHKWDVYYVDVGTLISAEKLPKKSEYQLMYSLPAHNEPVSIKCSEQQYLSAKDDSGLVIIEFPCVTDKRCSQFWGVFTSDYK